MTTNDIDAIRKLADAATDEPWTGANYRSALAGLATGTGNHAADAEFIRAARTLTPALCDELEQTRAALTESREQAATYANEIGRLTAENARLRAVADAAKTWRAQFAKPAATKTPRMAALISAVDALPTEAEVAR